MSAVPFPLNCKRSIAVVPGPEQQARDQSGPCRTSTTSARLDHAGPEQQGEDQSSPRRTRTASPQSERPEQQAEQQAQDQSGPCRTC